jgi:hypothetical protein
MISEAKESGRDGSAPVTRRVSNYFSASVFFSKFFLNSVVEWTRHAAGAYETAARMLKRKIAFHELKGSIKVLHRCLTRFAVRVAESPCNLVVLRVLVLIGPLDGGDHYSVAQFPPLDSLIERVTPWR